MVTIINGCAITADAGIVYYKFVPDPEPEEETAPETAPVIAPNPVYVYSYDTAPSKQSAWGKVGGVGLFLLAILSSLPGDEFAAGSALILAIP